MTIALPHSATVREYLIPALCAALGFATFWPVGLTYLLILILIGAILIRRSEWSARWQGLRSPMIFGILAFAVMWPVLTLLWHPVFNDTGTRLFHIVRVSLILMAGLLLLEHERDAALKGFVIGAVVAALIITVHSIHPLPEWDPWKHLLARKAHNASQKMVAMASVGGLLLVLITHRTMSWRLKATFCLAAAWMFIIVLAHGTSRNAYMLVVILPLAICVYQLRSLKLWCLVIAVMLVAVFVAVHSKPELLTRLKTSTSKLTGIAELEDSESSMGVRIKQWTVASELLVQFPLEGAGLGAWRSIWSQTPHLAPNSLNRTLNNPHNDFLLNGAELGLLGLLSIVAIVLWFLWRSWRMKSLQGAIAFSLTCAVIVTATVNAPFRDAGFGMSLMWLMAAACAASYTAVSKSSADRAS